MDCNTMNQMPDLVPRRPREECGVFAVYGHEEAAKLDAFIRYGKSLLRNVESAAAPEFEAPQPQPVNAPRVDQAPAESTDVPRPGIIRRSA